MEVIAVALLALLGAAGLGGLVLLETGLCHGCPGSSPLGSYLKTYPPVAQTAPNTWSERVQLLDRSQPIPLGALSFGATDPSGASIPIHLVCVANATTVEGTWLGGSTHAWSSGVASPHPACAGSTVPASRVPPGTSILDPDSTFYFYLASVAPSGGELWITATSSGFGGSVIQSIP